MIYLKCIQYLHFFNALLHTLSTVLYSTGKIIAIKKVNELLTKAIILIIPFVNFINLIKKKKENKKKNKDYCK